MELLSRFLLFVVFFKNGSGLSPLQRIISIKKSDAISIKRSFGIQEDNYLQFNELAQKYGFPNEKHLVTTEDEYVLTLFRIMPKCTKGEGERKYPILLAHGMFDSADTWIVTGPKKGLAYILAEKCYDVWLFNRRGNTYSRKHKRFNPDVDIEYWNFSFDESGNYDLPAVIDFVLNSTNKDKLTFIGHSQATTEFFVMTSLKPEYNEKIVLSIQLAPITWLKHLINPLIRFVAPSGADIKSILDYLGIRELFGRYQIPHVVLEVLCNMAPDYVFAPLLFLSTGYKQGTVSLRHQPIIFGHIMDGISSKGLAHFGQIIVSGHFERYDEGEKANIQRYGTAKVPKYNVSKAISPVVLIGAQSDWLSSVHDINILHSKLPNVIEKYIVPEEYWSHNDHLWGKKAPKLVFSKIYEYLAKYNP